VNAAAGLTVRNAGAGTEHRLVLAGELDIASAPILEATIASLCENGATKIVLDLSEPHLHGLDGSARAPRGRQTVCGERPDVLAGGRQRSRPAGCSS